MVMMMVNGNCDSSGCKIKSLALHLFTASDGNEKKKFHQTNLCVISGNLTLCEINLKFILNTALVFPKKIQRKCSPIAEMK